MDRWKPSVGGADIMKTVSIKVRWKKKGAELWDRFRCARSGFGGLRATGLYNKERGVSGYLGVMVQSRYYMPVKRKLMGKQVTMVKRQIEVNLGGKD